LPLCTYLFTASGAFAALRANVLLDALLTEAVRAVLDVYSFDEHFQANGAGQ
jgi:hypothetical protein